MKDKEKIKNEGDNSIKNKTQDYSKKSNMRAYCNTPQQTNQKNRANQNSPHQRLKVLQNRRSIRLKNYDYSGEGLYFITLCTTDRQHIFGEILNGEMHLNSLGKIASEEWKKTPEIRKNTSLGEFIIMPNHFHAIISIDYKIKDNGKENLGKFQSPSQTIGAIIRGFKGATTKRINNLIRENRENTDSTGVLQYAPTDQPANASTNAPTEAPTNESKESQFAPTTINLSGEGSIWQRNYYEHIIKSEKAFNNISNYIINNPLNWKIDKLK